MYREAALVMLLGFGCIPSSSEVDPVSQSQQSSADPDSSQSVEYPWSFCEQDQPCKRICIAFGPNEEDIFCDSDCDGWLDSVEEINHTGRCNYRDPSYPPEVPATICDDYVLYQKTSADLYRQIELAQLAELGLLDE